jgi:hypothetical protein
MFDQSRLSYLLFGLFLLIQTSSSHKNGAIKDVGIFCSNDTSLGEPNLNPIDENQPRLINKVENGTLYKIGSGEDEIWLVHLYGNTGYDFGYAYGTLLRDQIHKIIPTAWAHFEQEIMDEINNLKLPEWFKEFIVDNGLGVALDLQNDLVKNYMDEEIYNELRGVANAAQIEYKTMVRFHMFAEIIRGKFYI